METRGNHQDFPSARGVDHLNRFQGHLLPHTNTGTVQEVHEISHPGQVISVQCTVHSSHGVHSCSKGGETQGYKDLPVPRLVGEGQIPLNLSPAHLRTSSVVPELVNLEKSELDPKQVFDFVAYQLDLQSGRVRPTQERWQTLQQKILELLTPPDCPVRQFMSLIGLLTATEKQVHLGRLHLKPI